MTAMAAAAYPGPQRMVQVVAAWRTWLRLGEVGYFTVLQPIQNLRNDAC